MYTTRQARVAELLGGHGCVGVRTIRSLLITPAEPVDDMNNIP